jgi:hypothetical protein
MAAALQNDPVERFFRPLKEKWNLLYGFEYLVNLGSLLTS